MDETGGDQGQKNRLKGEMIAWEIWKEQCRAMHYGDNTMPEAVIHVGINLAKDTWRTRQSTVAEPARRPIATQHRWSKPELKVIKINCDATWVAEKGRNWDSGSKLGGENNYRTKYNKQGYECQKPGSECNIPSSRINYSSQVEGGNYRVKCTTNCTNAHRYATRNGLGTEEPVKKYYRDGEECFKIPMEICS